MYLLRLQKAAAAVSPPHKRQSWGVTQVSLTLQPEPCPLGYAIGRKRVPLEKANVNSRQVVLEMGIEQGVYPPSSGRESWYSKHGAERGGGVAGRILKMWGQSHSQMRKCNTTQPSARQMLLIKRWKRYTHCSKAAHPDDVNSGSRQNSCPEPCQHLRRQSQIWAGNSGGQSLEPTSVCIECIDLKSGYPYQACFMLYAQGVCKGNSMPTHLGSQVALFCTM